MLLIAVSLIFSGAANTGRDLALHTLPSRLPAPPAPRCGILLWFPAPQASPAVPDGGGSFPWDH